MATTSGRSPGDQTANGDDRVTGHAPGPVDISGAVGHPASEVVDVDLPDVGPVTDQDHASAGVEGLTGADVAGLTGAYAPDLTVDEDRVPRPD